MIFSRRIGGMLSLLITILFCVLSISDTHAKSGDDFIVSKETTQTKNEIFMLPFTRIMGKFFMVEEFKNDKDRTRFVSKEFSLSLKTYSPPDLELMTGGSIDTAGRVIYFRKEALDALNLLARDFEIAMKRPLVVVSGYRSANYQQRLWDLGRCTDTLCAPPGYSEHQLGLAIDIFEATTEKDYLANRAFARYLNWFQENAHKYGFHQSYQKGEKIDAYEVEPWHWRYLGIPLATRLKNLNMTYTEYVEFMSMRKFWELY